MSIPCIWCGRDLNAGGRVSLMRALVRDARPAVDPKAVVPVYPPAPPLQLNVSCACCRSSVSLPADYPEAWA